MNDEYKIVYTYSLLLTISPDHDFRILNQPLYAALRDYISERSGSGVESTQNLFEYMATLIKNRK